MRATPGRCLQPLRNPIVRSVFSNGARLCALLSLLLLSPAPAQADARQTAAARETSPGRISGIDPELLAMAMGAVACAQAQGEPAAERLAVIDFRRSSVEPRLWVFDLQTQAQLFEERVAHGRGSGDARALRFSNQPDSHTSSLGLYRTLDTYEGGNGYSLRLQGLEAGVNDRAYERAIVIHGADYVSDGFVRTAGRLGRSYGCPAVRREIARPLIDSLKGQQYLFAYYPDSKWLESSRYLGCTPTLPETLPDTGPQNLPAIADGELVRTAARAPGRR